MLAINLYYLNLLGRLIFRPRELILGEGLGAGSPPLLPPSAACATRARFAFGFIFCEAVLLPLWDYCRDFLAVAASFLCCFLR